MQGKDVANAIIDFVNKEGIDILILGEPSHAWLQCCAGSPAMSRVPCLTTVTLITLRSCRPPGWARAGAAARAR